jgi:hypothetical protein
MPLLMEAGAIAGFTQRQPSLLGMCVTIPVLNVLNELFLVFFLA